ncbi:hypothetical protein EV421DRAFT_1923425 [Armillaria borealis]|uniref:Uncharacterized protein n=1 Tax=Armillaria borealis TaxID=47425 RepID=A0AA39JWL4_9AGAR|nr:hypothetical protein EV421DRAFT_1923425 [Armillaria borealis]
MVRHAQAIKEFQTPCLHQFDKPVPAYSLHRLRKPDYTEMELVKVQPFAPTKTILPSVSTMPISTEEYLLLQKNSDVPRKPRFMVMPSNQLSQIEVFPELKGKLVTIDAKRWYNMYGLARGLPSEWAYDWETKKEIHAVAKGQGCFLIKRNQAKQMATDLQYLSLCIRDIQKHTLFMDGTLLPPSLDSISLFQHDFSSSQQISNLIKLAQVSFCMGMAFINAWRITIGSSWDYMIMPGRMAFL